MHHRTGSLRRAPLLVASAAFSGLVGASSSALTEAEILRHFAELEQLVEKQQATIERLEHEAQRDRRLSDTEAVTLSSLATQVSALETRTNDENDALDHIWLLLCGALVMFMQAGFAMVEAGCCRSKNVQNILLKNLTDVAVGTMGWWAFGFAVAFGNADTNGDGALDNGFAGTRYWFGTGFMETDASGVQIPTGKKQLLWFFQWAFCSAGATIVSGGVAERVKFPGYVMYSFLMSAFIYPVVVAWTWGYGWVQQINDVSYIDFAGSGIVHMTGGIGALVGAVVAGPRDGRWTYPEEYTPHNLPLIVLGTFILWFGWYGFNCGSTLELHTAAKGELAAQVAMNTTIAGSAGGLVVFALRVGITRGKYDLGGFCNGILAGLVSITAGCSNVDVGSALLIGSLGGCFYQCSSMLILKLEVDDPIDAFSVHGISGLWGVLAAAFFDWGKGFDAAHGWSNFDCVRDSESNECMSNAWSKLLLANLVEIVAIIGWVGTLTAMVFVPLRYMGWLRAEAVVQELGMDEAKHSPQRGYQIDVLKDVARANSIDLTYV